MASEHFLDASSLCSVIYSAKITGMLHDLSQVQELIPSCM